MKFAHFADVHIGSWRDQKLADISTRAFLKGLEVCRSENVDFILISGDFFNTALPAIERLKEVVVALKQLSESSIPVYVIAGSHDFSPTGKTMLDVLEQAGLFVNVMRGSIEDGKLRLRFTVDAKTGAKIVGIIGKKGMLDHAYYEALDTASLENEPGPKIFMFHTALTEFKPKELEKMDSAPLSLLPKGFDYYAGGHVHYVFSRDEPGYGPITFPGPVFPNNFREVEKLKGGGFYIVEQRESKMHYRHVPIILHPVVSLVIDCAQLSPEQVEQRATALIAQTDMQDAIVTMRFAGRLSRGKPSAIHFDALFHDCYDRGAFFVMKNTAALTGEDFEEVQQHEGSIEQIEQHVLTEHAGQVELDGYSTQQQSQLAVQLLQALSIEKDEGETSTTFERRLLDDARRILNVRLE